MQCIITEKRSSQINTLRRKHAKLPSMQGTNSHFSLIVWLQKGRCFFCGSFLLFMFRVCLAFWSVHCSLVVTCWERANLDQESIQSSTTPDPGHHMGKWQKHKKTLHTRGPRVSPFPPGDHEHTLKRLANGYMGAADVHNCLTCFYAHKTSFLLDIMQVHFYNINGIYAVYH